MSPQLRCHGECFILVPQITVSSESKKSKRIVTSCECKQGSHELKKINQYFFGHFDDEIVDIKLKLLED